MCEHCGWEKFCEEIEELLDDDRYRKSHVYLRSIMFTVKKYRHATSGQAQAIYNVQERGW